MRKSKLLKVFVALGDITYSIEGIPPKSGTYIVGSVLKNILKEDLRYFKSNQKMDFLVPLHSLFGGLPFEEIKRELLALKKMTVKASNCTDLEDSQQFTLLCRFDLLSRYDYEPAFLSIGISTDFILFCKVLKSGKDDPWTDLISQLQKL
jgi:hypothetical protein